VASGGSLGDAPLVGELQGARVFGQPAEEAGAPAELANLRALEQPTLGDPNGLARYGLARFVVLAAPIERLA